MASSFFALYDALLEGTDSAVPVGGTLFGDRWAMAELGGVPGIAMATAGDSFPPVFPGSLQGLPLSQAAKAVKSWNFPEASLALAAINAWYNTPQRLEALACGEDAGEFYTDGLDLTGKTVGMVGHMRGPEGLRQQVRELFILEKEPKPGDYPDSACDLLLPQCDVVILTGSSLVNKTLPHLLELCRDAYTILTGPSVPLCPALLELGIDRLSGLVLTDLPGIRAHVAGGLRGSPFRFGRPFLLKR